MLLMYQIKVGICLIAFYLLWKLLLSRETFHRFNRVALLAVMVLALVLPWVRLSMNVSTPVAGQMIVLEELLITPDGAVAAQHAAHTWSMTSVTTVIYIIGIVIALLWLIHSQWNLHRLLRTGRKELLPDGITLHVLPGDISPFSYFKHIVINEQDYRDNPQEILTHELAHIGLRHSWDVMFMGLVTLFQWWNPAAWLLCRELKQVHEYEADEAVLKSNVDVKQYQLLLIRKSVGDQLFSMANNFNYQSLKKRIRMMTINKSSRWNRLRALAAVPVIALALLAFANPTIDAAPKAPAVADEPANVTPLPDAVQTSQPEVALAVEEKSVEEKTIEDQAVADQVIDDQNIDEKASETSAQDDKVFQSVEQMPEFPGGMAEMLKFLQMNIKYPPTAAANKIEGRVIVQFIIDKTGQVGDVQVVRSVNEELDAEAVRVIKSMPKFTPGRQDGKAVAVWYTLPIAFKLQGNPEKQSPSEP